MSKALQVLQLMGATPCDPNDGLIRRGPSPDALFYEWNGLLLTMGETYFWIDSYMEEYRDDIEPEYAEVMLHANRLWENMKAYHHRVWQEVERFKAYFQHAPFTTTTSIDETEHDIRFYIKGAEQVPENMVAGFRIHYRDCGPIKSPRKKFSIAPMGALSVFPHMECLRYEEVMVKNPDQFESMLAEYFSRVLDDENGVYAVLDKDKMQMVIPAKYGARFFGYMRNAISVQHSEIVLKTTAVTGEADLAAQLFPYMNANVTHKVLVVEL